MKVGEKLSSILDDTTILVLISIIVGIVTGFATVAFRMMFYLSEKVLYPDNFVKFIGISKEYYFLSIPLVVALGGLLVGLITYYIAPESKGHGVPSVIVAVLKRGGIIKKRAGIFTAINSAITLGSGGSAGSEGPIVQIGASIASNIGQLFKLKPVKMRVLVASGASAGIGSIFNAPFAGVFFALEVILADFNITSFSPVIIASVIASYISMTLMPETIIIAPKAKLHFAYELFLLTILGILMGFIGYIYNYVFHKVEDFFENLKIKPFLKPALGGLAVGCIGIVFPYILGVGYPEITKAMFNKFTLEMFLILGFLKIFTTSLTLGSGGSGGLFAPALYIGAMLGAFFGNFLKTSFSLPISPEVYSIVGMGALLAGAAHIPFTSIMLVLEVTGDYHLMIPAMLTATLATIVSKKINPYSIFTQKLSKEGIDFKRGSDVSVLHSYSVLAILEKKFPKIYRNQPLSEVLKIFQRSKYDEIPVIDKENKLYGVISFQSLREAITERPLYHLLIAEEIADRDWPFLSENASLYEAFSIFNKYGVNILPILSSSDNRIIGIITYSTLMNFYRKELLLKDL